MLASRGACPVAASGPSSEGLRCRTVTSSHEILSLLKIACSSASRPAPPGGFTLSKAAVLGIQLPVQAPPALAARALRATARAVRHPGLERLGAAPRWPPGRGVPRGCSPPVLGTDPCRCQGPYVVVLPRDGPEPLLHLGPRPQTLRIQLGFQPLWVLLSRWPLQACTSSVCAVLWMKMVRLSMHTLKGAWRQRLSVHDRYVRVERQE
mmetsp:Transcript_73565/g.239473  ORF Transcript_73565/g.239473 Transcript_73565/m.239473 type:complete len:208 (+) Transcript_73565:1795-2418(+)